MDRTMDRKLWIIATIALIFLGVHFYQGEHDGSSDQATVISLPGYENNLAQDQPSTSTDGSPSLKAFNDEIVKIAKNTNPTVVTVFTTQTIERNYRNPFYPFFGGQPQYERRYQRSGLGSGVVVSGDGYIITNNHVIENADSIAVRFINDESRTAEVVGADPLTDIAVLKVKGEDLPSVEFGDSDALQVGEFVLAIGSPLSENLAHTVTMGIVSAKGRSNLGVIGQQGGRVSYENFIQTDAAINPGNSGGALIDLNGKLVGINSAIASRSGGFQGIGLAIPVNMAKSVMESLIEYGEVRRGYLGIRFASVNKNIADIYDLKDTNGIIITDVLQDEAADKAGLKVDDIVVAVDGKEIKSGTELAREIGMKKPGDKVTLSIIRDDKKMKKTVTLGEMETGEEVASEESQELQERLGFAVQTLNDELRREYNVGRSVQGVVVTDISQRSRAYQQGGVREGDIIIEVNRRDIENRQQFIQLMSQLRPGSPVVYKVVRDGQVGIADFRF